jgi:hypothetical protein
VETTAGLARLSLVLSRMQSDHEVFMLKGGNTAMLKEITYQANDPEASGNPCISHINTYKTVRGPLFLQSCSSPAFVEGLQADEGLRAFARLPEREHQLLLDYAGLGMSRFHYRELIARLFAAHGFAEYLTSEPNIRMDPANILVARLGRCLGQESMNRFFERLLQSETLPGL